MRSGCGLRCISGVRSTQAQGCTLRALPDAQCQPLQCTSLQAPSRLAAAITGAWRACAGPSAAVHAAAGGPGWPTAALPPTQARCSQRGHHLEQIGSHDQGAARTQLPHGAQAQRHHLGARPVVHKAVHQLAQRRRQRVRGDQLVAGLQSGDSGIAGRCGEHWRNSWFLRPHSCGAESSCTPKQHSPGLCRRQLPLSPAGRCLTLLSSHPGGESHTPPHVSRCQGARILPGQGRPGWWAPPPGGAACTSAGRGTG